MNRMGYDALTVGQGELRLGSDQLLEIRDQANFPFLSANLTRGEGGPLLVQPYSLLQMDRHWVAVIGVTAPEATDIHQLEEGEVAVLDPIESVRQQVATARDQAEVIVVLSYLGLESDQQLAQHVEGIDLIVGGRSGENLVQPLQNELTGTVIVQAGKRGEWLGIIDLELDQRGRIVSYEGRSQVLEESIPEDPDLADWLRSVLPTPTPALDPSD
jgi:2',3'-cyclic-nucleotide 2'-phosphodiesterase (5'-nucleotidase family)